MNLRSMQNSVAKFGGTSVAQDLDVIEKVMHYDNDNINRNYIVVSAPGKRSSSDTKVTDLLLKLANDSNSSKEKFDEIMDRLNAISMPNSKALITLEEILKDRLDKKIELAPSTFTASIAAFGEEASARLIAERTDATYVDQKELFRLEANNGDYSNGKYNQKISEELIRKALSEDKGEKFIIPGFFGYDKNGNIVTFSRGGSDITQAYLAVALNADLAENFTDSGRNISCRSKNHRKSFFT